MGSKKYPDENGYDKFINSNGGSNNAYTTDETTTFYFEIPQSHFAEALDMFAQFFIEPLILKDSMDRERETVDSEFQMRLTSDGRRCNEIFTSIAKENGHPTAQFSMGNKKSLSMVRF